MFPDHNVAFKKTFFGTVTYFLKLNDRYAVFNCNTLQGSQ